MPSIMQKNYSHCPLKKRPVQIVKEEITETVIPEIVSNDEPQNLSTKPEDLSLTGNYPRKTPSPVFRQRTPSPIRRPVSPIRRSISPIPVPTPTYAPVPISYLQKSSPIHHQIAMHSPTPSNEQLHYASPTNWHKPIAAPTAAYPSYMFGGYPQMNYHSEHYQSMYHHQVSPTRSEPLSPYAQRESSMSPPSHHQYQIKRESSLSPPTMSAYPELRRVNHNNNIIKSESHYTNRYMPYHINHHHVIPHHPMMMPVDQSSLSPTSSHTSYNSMISSSLRSSSPVSLPSSTPEDLSQIANHSVSVLMEKSTSCANILKVKKENNGEKLNGAPRYQCNDCGKSYSTYSGLTKHTQFHCPAAEGNQAKKSFSCKNCDKVYVSLGALKMHIRTHTLPCKCQICGKAFSRPWLLQGHIRTHTGEKPFSCQHCHRAFADRSNLRAHLQTHSDVKKYSCTSCSKTFSRMSLLTKHTEGGCPGLQIGSQGYSSSIKQELSVY